jgi:hypothetical protein
MEPHVDGFMTPDDFINQFMDLPEGTTLPMMPDNKKPDFKRVVNEGHFVGSFVNLAVSVV